MKTLIKQYTVFVVGLAVMALAIATMSHAALGISPVQSLSYVIYNRFSQYISLGTLMFIWNCILFVMQPILLGRRFKLINILQLPLSLFFSWAVDAFVSLLSFISPTLFIWKLLLMLASVVALALGISITLAARTIMNPGEAFVAALAERSGFSFSRVKMATDIGIISAALIASFLFFGRWRSDIIGLGTLTSGIGVGFLIRFFNKILAPVAEKMCNKERKKEI